MSSLSRSIRSPNYLSARRRPAMPARTASGSSEFSMTFDDDGEVALASGQTTPSIPNYQRRYLSASHQPASPAESPVSTPSREYVGGGTRPMAIDIPRVNRMTNLSARTPPEPLSARGDLPGGYFPMHEDPESRIYRPHPFHPENRPAAIQNHPWTNHAFSDDDILGDLDATIPHTSPSKVDMSNTEDTKGHIPVILAYMPVGHANALPMGKYYPSNWENRTKEEKQKDLESDDEEVENKSGESSKSSKSNKGKGKAVATVPATAKVAATATATATVKATPAAQGKKKRTASASEIEPLSLLQSYQALQPLQPLPPLEPLESLEHATFFRDGVISPEMAREIEARRRLLLYQRDMMAQVSLRAYELLAAAQNPQDLLDALPALSLGSSSAKPDSPRLHPTVASPGPVTPMNLNESAVGCYLDLGNVEPMEPHVDPPAGSSAGPSAGPSGLLGRGYHAHSM